MALAGVFFAAEPGLAQEAPLQGGPVLDNTQPLVTGGALQERRPGLLVGRARARFNEATARLGRRFPLQELDSSGGQEDRKFGAELLNSVLETVFDEVNSFLSLIEAFFTFGQGAGSATDLADLLGQLTGQTAPATTAPQVQTEPSAPLPDLLPATEQAPSPVPKAF